MVIWLHFIGVKIELTFPSKSIKAVFLSEVSEQEENFQFINNKIILNRKFEGDLEWLRNQMSQL